MTRARKGLMKVPILRNLLHKPRLMICIAAGLTVFFTIDLFTTLRLATCALLAWNTGTLIYLCLSLNTMLDPSLDTIQRRAALHDDGEVVILLFSVLAAISSLIAIIAELATAKSGGDAMRAFHIGLSALTLLTSWSFIHTAFAFHYAHGYYADSSLGKTPCLIFPGNTPAPPYTDFLYFSFIIGTSGQTADIGLASPAIRRIGLLHCVLAYLFNATVLALTINIAASLIS